MRSFVFLLLLASNAFSSVEQVAYTVDDYYALLNSPPVYMTGDDQEEEKLQAFFRQAWPESGSTGYFPSSYIRTAEERRAFVQALQRLTRDRLSVAGNTTPGSAAYSHAVFAQFWNGQQTQPLAHRALVLSLGGTLDEDDVWRLISHRLRNDASKAAFADLPLLFPASETHWTARALAVFELALQGPPTALGIQRLLARYQMEGQPRHDSEPTPSSLRLALPIRGLYSEPVENLLALIEGQHLWRAQGRVDLAREGLEKLRVLEASLAKQLDQSISGEVARALAAPIHYISSAQSLPKALHRPEEEPNGSAGEREEKATAASLRWIRADASAQPLKPSGEVEITRRIASTDERWWPAYQESYLDLAYRGLPELLRQQLAREGQLDVFRVWHAGAEDGSQTFLLAALIDEAIALLMSQPDAAHLAEELGKLRVEIIATDYAYMPERQGLIYRFDVSGQLGDLHHKWNVIAEERGSTPAGDDIARAADPATTVAEEQERLHIQRLISNSATAAERGVTLRTLADSGRAAELLGLFFTLAPEVDVPSGAWRKQHPASAAKHRYRLTDQRWRVVELHEGAPPRIVSPGSAKRLIRFEKGDMTRRLPTGFEQGDAFDLSVVTGVLPYIYGYYRQQDEENLMANRKKDVTGTRLTPMEKAQNNLAHGARGGAWILVDPPTEHAALAARGRLHALDSNYENWSDAWIHWVRSTLAARDIELRLTYPSGVEPATPSRYEAKAGKH